MKMIHLKFENAGYFPKTKNTPKNWVWSEADGKNVHSNVGSGNWTDPVTVNIVANVLRALCGDIPVPTLKPIGNLINRNAEYDESAAGAYVKYLNPMSDGRGRPVLMESVQTNKSHMRNSNSKISKVFELYDGRELEVSGSYGWHYFDETFSRDGMDEGHMIVSFLDGILGLDVRSLTFDTVVGMLSERWDDPEFGEKACGFLESSGIGKKIGMSWCWVIFGGVYENGKLVRRAATGSNTDFKKPTPILYTRGIGDMKHIDGEIWCPVSDEMIRMTGENGGTATVLDGGLVYVVEIENCDGRWLESEGFHKILSREDAISACAAMGCGK